MAKNERSNLLMQKATLQLVLLCHKRGDAATFAFRKQHGQRGRRLASATAMWRRSVVIENGAWRSGRRGVATRPEAFGRRRDADRERAADWR